MRMVHFFMVIAALMQLYLLHTLTSDRQPGSAAPVFNYVFTAVGVADFAIALGFRTFLIRKALPALQADAMNAQAQQKWRAANIVSSAFAYAIFLFGWVLAVLGGAQWAYILLWAVAAIAFFLFVPQPPFDEASQANMPSNL